MPPGSPPGCVLILGAASSSVVLAIDLAEECGVTVGALVDNLPPGEGQVVVSGYPLYYLPELPLELRSLPVICAGRTPEYRRRMVGEALAAGLRRFATLVHPAAHVSRHATLGAGCTVDWQAHVASRARLGDHVIVGKGASISHDNVVEPFVTVHKGVLTGGYVRLCEGAYLGMGAVVQEKVTVGRNAVVAAGAVVTRDVPDQCLVAGVPAVIKRRGIPGYRGA